MSPQPFSPEHRLRRSFKETAKRPWIIERLDNIRVSNMRRTFTVHPVLAAETKAEAYRRWTNYLTRLTRQLGSAHVARIKLEETPFARNARD